jgi:hypothetical protein
MSNRSCAEPTRNRNDQLLSGSQYCRGECPPHSETVGGRVIEQDMLELRMRRHMALIQDLG